MLMTRSHRAQIDMRDNASLAMTKLLAASAGSRVVSVFFFGLFWSFFFRLSVLFFRLVLFFVCGSGYTNI